MEESLISNRERLRHTDLGRRIEESLISNRNGSRHTDLGRRILISYVVRSTLLQVTRGRQNAPGGLPPVCAPGTPLTNDISGSSSSNERFLTCINTFFSVEYDGMNVIPVRQREHQEHFRFWSKSWRNHEKLMIPE